MGFGGDFSSAVKKADLTLLEIFGGEVDIDGRPVLAVMDDDQYREYRAKRQSDNVDEIFTAGTLLTCRLDDLGFRPDRGSLLTVEGKPFFVGNVTLGEGLLEIELEAREV